MNQAQRNFLIKKIEETKKTKVKQLEASRPERPSLEAYLLHEIMSDKFKLQPLDHIRKAITNKALKLKKDESLLGDGRWSSKDTINLNPGDIFIIPSDYTDLQDQYLALSEKVNAEIKSLEVQADNLILRIQLASDRTLQKMINEIDDMGDISLMDTKIKLLGNE